MLFSTVIVSALVFLQGSFAAPTVRAPNALTVQQVVDNIGTVTKVSGDLAKAIEPIGIRSTPQDVAAASKVSTSNFFSSNEAIFMYCSVDCCHPVHCDNQRFVYFCACYGCYLALQWCWGHSGGHSVERCMSFTSP